jgi:hypothetical protein
MTAFTQIKGKINLKGLSIFEFKRKRLSTLLMTYDTSIEDHKFTPLQQRYLTPSFYQQRHNHAFQ